MCDPLGRSQVLPYLMGLSTRGHRITLVSFEKPERTAEERAEVARLCKDAGIDWRPLPYRRSLPCSPPLPTCGGCTASHGASLRRRPLPRLYPRPGRPVAQASDRRALPVRAARLLGRRAPRGRTGQRLACCVDFDLFSPADAQRRGEARALLGLGLDEHVLGYIGSLVGNCMLDEMLALELPVVVNGGVGDVAEVAGETGSGVMIDDFSRTSYERAIDALERLQPDLGRWRTGSRKWFDLEQVAARYHSIYQALSGRRSLTAGAAVAGTAASPGTRRR